eukprot:6468471-Amphidinium_carterae.3
MPAHTCTHVIGGKLPGQKFGEHCKQTVTTPRGRGWIEGGTPPRTPDLHQATNCPLGWISTSMKRAEAATMFKPVVHLNLRQRATTRGAAGRGPISTLWVTSIWRKYVNGLARGNGRNYIWT